jgi:hypothetical protein
MSKIDKNGRLYQIESLISKIESFLKLGGYSQNA